MTTKYLAWKDTHCNGNNIEWLELTGREFFALVSRSENKMRRFIKLDNSICSEADVIFIEATEPQYRKWRSENSHHKYLLEMGNGIVTLSMDMLMGEEDPLPLHEMASDESVNIEESVMHICMVELLPRALNTLTELERTAIQMSYLSSTHVTDDAICLELGIPVSTFSDRKQRALMKLKKFFQR